MADKVYWTTKDGRKMNVDDMDDNHVRNAFKMVLRRIDQLKEEAKAKEKTDFIRPRGDIAQMMQDDADALDMFNNHAFDDMEPWDWRDEQH